MQELYSLIRVLFGFFCVFLLFSDHMGYYFDKRYNDMESSRFSENKNFFIVGVVCLVVGLIFFIISFYTFPRLVFNWRYQIPTFIVLFSEYLQSTYHLKSVAAGWLVFISIFTFSIFMFIIADIASNKIDSKFTYNADDYNTKKKVQVEEQGSLTLIFKIILIIILVFIASELFQWAISI